jgi:hypothetical protein
MDYRDIDNATVLVESFTHIAGPNFSYKLVTDQSWSRLEV